MSVATLSSFLNARKIPAGDNSPHNHTSKCDNDNSKNGKYFIADADFEEFAQLYYKSVFEKKQEQFLIEVPHQDGNCIVVDCDWKHDIKKGTTRRYNITHIEKIVKHYNMAIRKYLDIGEAEIRCTTFEKDTPTLLEDVVKDGVHILFHIKCPFPIQRQIYLDVVKMIEDDAELVEELQCTNTVGPKGGWLDERMSNGSTGLFMLGSKKLKGGLAYELGAVYDVMPDNSLNAINATFGDDNFKTLCIRYPDNPSFEPTADGLCLLMEKEAVITPPPPASVKAMCFPAEVSIPANNKWHKLLMEVIGNGEGVDERGKRKRENSREDWMAVMCAIQSNKWPKEWFVEWSQLIHPNRHTNTASDLWDRTAFRGYSGSVGTLINLAKREHSMDKYKRWRDEYSQNISLEDLNKGINTVAQWIVKKGLKDILVYSNDSFYALTNQNLWRSTKAPDSLIVSFIQQEIEFARENVLSKKNSLPLDAEEERKKLIEVEKGYAKWYPNVSIGSYVSQIKKFLKGLLEDTEFEDKLDKSFYKLAFKNGIYDLSFNEKTGKANGFRQGIRATDYLTKTIPHDYEPANTDDITTVEKDFLKICNMKQEHLDYHLGAIGYALCSDPQREIAFWYSCGQTASNGKSTIYEVLEGIMPNYVAKAKSECLDKGADLKKEVNTWRGLKLLWLNELTRAKKNGELLNCICDGTTYKYDKLYSTSSITMPIDFKVHMVSNHSLNIEMSNGVARRARIEQFNSQFIDADKLEKDDVNKCLFVKNLDMKADLQGRYRNAVLHILIGYATRYAEKKSLFPFPPEWNTETKDLIEDNQGFQQWFEENCMVGTFTKTSDAEAFFIMRQTLENEIPLEFRDMKIKDELLRMRVPFEYDAKKRFSVGGVQLKGMFQGFRMKTFDEKKKEEDAQRAEEEKKKIAK